MHYALLLVAAAIARSYDIWLHRVGRRRPRRTRDVNAGTLSVRFLDGDCRLPILRLRRAA